MREVVDSKLNQLDNYVSQYETSIFHHLRDAEVEEMRAWLCNEWRKATLSEEYYDFMKRTDGIDFNGLDFYSLLPSSLNNIYKANKDYWEADTGRQYLYLGEDSISWYCLSSLDGNYYILDKPSGTTIEKFSSFDNMLIAALESIGH